MDSLFYEILESSPESVLNAVKQNGGTVRNGIGYYYEMACNIASSFSVIYITNGVEAFAKFETDFASERVVTTIPISGPDSEQLFGRLLRNGNRRHDASEMRALFAFEQLLWRFHENPEGT